jgi:phosphatidylglycerophosphatase A
MKFIPRTYASFFGLGFVPLAPGTAASAAVAALYYFFLSEAAWPAAAGLVLFLFLSGVPAAAAAAKEFGHKDPRRVVIDEAAGQLAVLLFCPSDWIAVGAGFILFRLFDVLKPFPIRKLELLPGGWGIMADDLGAAVYAWAALRLILLVRGS